MSRYRELPMPTDPPPPPAPMAPQPDTALPFEPYPDTLDEACAAFADRLERLFILGGSPEAMSVASIVRHFGANFPRNMVAPQPDTASRDVSCCELACYEDPGCCCDGCATQPDTASRELDVERLARALVRLAGCNEHATANQLRDPGDYAAGVPTVDAFAALIAREYAALAATEEE